MVPGSELEIGRVAYRNNTSDYYINGRKHQAKVVVERLKQEGIDLNHNRFLILQVLDPPLAFLDGLSAADCRTSINAPRCGRPAAREPIGLLHVHHCLQHLRTRQPTFEL